MACLVSSTAGLAPSRVKISRAAASAAALGEQCIHAPARQIMQRQRPPTRLGDPLNKRRV